MRKRRKSSTGSTLDGFVKRRSGVRQAKTHDRSTIDRLNNSPSRKSRDQMIEFVPRSKPAEFAGQGPRDKEEWSDDGDTLTLRELDQHIKGDNEPKPARPRWWQFKKRHLWRQERQSIRRRKLKRLLLLVGVILLLVGGYTGFKFVSNFAKVFDGNILGLFDSTKLKGEDQGRVNILLAGTSEDEGPEHGGAELTDSIMLISLDTQNNTGMMTSIPRDLWVEYDGQACNSGYEGKINEAYLCGNNNNFSEAGYEAGGMGLLSKIVSENFGIPIHYTTKINYTAFRQAVDAVGGIDVEIKSRDSRGIYDYNQGGLRLSNGRHHLDGDTALRLARARGSFGGYGFDGGDFDRTTYQREMLIALKDKALSSGVVANPAKMISLLDAAGANVDTSFQTNELRRLYELSKLIGNDKIESINLAGEDVNLVTNGNYGNASIVRPTAGLKDFSEIKQYFKKLISNDPISKEAASIVVLNGSGVVGFAQKNADQLEAKGLTVTSVGNASQSLTSTVIIDKTNGQKASTKALLEQNFGITATTDAGSYNDASLYDADFVVLLGGTLAQ